MTSSSRKAETSIWFGYHNAVPVAAGTQTYAVAAWLDPGFFFSPIHDIGGWSHELAEWADDPFVQQKVPGGGLYDRTPAWGNVGQVSGCQDNLEVGDPLTGTAYPIAGAGGYTYTFQDLGLPRLVLPHAGVRDGRQVLVPGRIHEQRRRGVHGVRAARAAAGDVSTPSTCHLDVSIFRVIIDM